MPEGAPDAILAELEGVAADLVQRALDAGATSAEAYVRQGSEASIQIRDGEVEELHEGQPKSVGLRVWRDDRVASTYATDLREPARQMLVMDALELAGLTDPVPESALADAPLLAREYPDLDLFDSAVKERTADEKLALVHEMESAALGADPRIARSAGAQYGDSVMHRALVTSHGFCGGYASSSAHLAIEVVADDEGGKKRNGSWYTFGRHLDQLESAASVGVEAAARTVRQIGAGPVPTKRMPVVFDPRTAAALIGLLFSVVRGGAVERRASYLADKLGERIGSDLLHVHDNPLIARGPGSRPFDGEGLPAAETVFVRDGHLQTFALNAYNARKLGLTPTGHASRPASGSPGEAQSNLILRPGDVSPESLIADIERGFYCESMMGFGFNATTGDFSRGASGRLIENGRLTRPVSEVTVSANFVDLFGALDALANDLDTRRSVQCPTMRIAEMTLAGS